MEDDAVEDRLQPAGRTEQVQPVEANGQEDDGHERSRHVEIAGPIGRHAQERRRIGGQQEFRAEQRVGAAALAELEDTDATPTSRPAPAKASTR